MCLQYVRVRLIGYFFPSPNIFLFLSPFLWDGYMTSDFTSFSTELQLYQDDGWVMDGCV